MQSLFLLLLISTVMSLKIGVSRPSTTKTKMHILDESSTHAVFNRRNALSSIGSAGVAVLLSPQLAFAVDDETADMVARM